MGILKLLTADVTVTRRTVDGTDEYGNPDFAETVETTVGYAEQTVAYDDRGERSTEEWRVFLPAGTDLTAGDRVAIYEVTLEVAGPPHPVHNPRLGAVSHVEAPARQVT